jgi:hypothetical protein
VATPSTENPLRGSCLCGGVQFEITAGRVPRDGFELLAGEELIQVWWPQGDQVGIRLGSLDGDPGIRPEFHTFVCSKAAWGELPDDGLPRYEERYIDA